MDKDETDLAGMEQQPLGEGAEFLAWARSGPRTCPVCKGVFNWAAHRDPEKERTCPVSADKDRLDREDLKWCRAHPMKCRLRELTTTEQTWMFLAWGVLVTHRAVWGGEWGDFPVAYFVRS